MTAIYQYISHRKSAQQESVKPSDGHIARSAVHAAALVLGNLSVITNAFKFLERFKLEPLFADNNSLT